MSLAFASSTFQLFFGAHGFSRSSALASGSSAWVRKTKYRSFTSTMIGLMQGTKKKEREPKRKDSVWKKLGTYHWRINVLYVECGVVRAGACAGSSVSLTLPISLHVFFSPLFLSSLSPPVGIFETSSSTIDGWVSNFVSLSLLIYDI